MSEKNAPWVSLAGRVVRVALMRKDIGYAELSKRLAAFGIRDDDKALAARVAVGRVRLELFLQILCVIDAELPTLWNRAIEKASSWEACARDIVQSEVCQIPPMTVDEIANRLTTLGVGFTHDTIVTRVSTGNLFLPDFLKCLVILRSRSLDAFIEYKDLVQAAHSHSDASDDAEVKRWQLLKKKG